MRFDSRGLQMAVGTSSGHVVLYDIRKSQPLLVKDHQYGLPILDLKYLEDTGHVISTDSKIIKVWERDSGKAFTNIQPDADINDGALKSDVNLDPWVVSVGFGRKF